MNSINYVLRLKASELSARWACAGSALAVFASRMPVVSQALTALPRLSLAMPGFPQLALPVAVGVGAYNTVSGATGIVFSPELTDNTLTLDVGEPINLTFFINSSEHGTAQAYTIRGDVPEGITPQAGVIKDTQFVTFQGAPTVANVYNIEIKGWEFGIAAGNSSEFFPLTIVVLSTGAGPSFNSHPANATVNWGGPVQFSASASNAASFRWQRNGVDLADGGNVSGAVASTLNLGHALAVDNGASYRVVVLGGDGSEITSNAASLTVPSTDFERWRETCFAGEDRFNDAVSGPFSDSDGDSHVAAIEFVLNLDPHRSDSNVITSMQLLDNGGSPTMQVTLPRNPAISESAVVFETAPDTVNGPWSPLPPEQVDSTAGDQWVISMPGNGPANYLRYRVTIQETSGGG